MSFFSYEGIQWKFTTALAPWQGGFYERLVGIVKKALRKGMGRKVLYWDKLLTLLTEVEAIINTRPLTYVCEDFKSSFVLTPSHFLIGGYNNANPFDTDDIDEYILKLDSAQELLVYWRKNQKQLQIFWKSWIQDYLLNLRETLPLSHKGPRSQVLRQPQIGEIVLVRDESIPRRAWKLAKVKEFILSRDNQVRSVKVQLPNKNILDRPINHLYPLEIPSVINNDDLPVIKTSPIADIEDIDDQQKQIKRKAAINARAKISEYLRADAVTVTFSACRECHGENTD